MRTKALLCAAAFAACIGTAVAQNNVYSLNVVGYYNVTIPQHSGNPSQPLNQHAAMIANQFNTTNNSLNALFPNGPVNATINKYVTGTGFKTYQFDEFDLVWYPADAGGKLDPGEGALFINPVTQTTPLTLTFVGEVPQGSLTNPIPNGLSVVANMVPQAWGPGDAAQNFPNVPNDVVNQFFPNLGFISFQFDEFDLVWYPSNPLVKVGESVLLNKVGAVNWVRNFTVQ